VAHLDARDLSTRCASAPPADDGGVFLSEGIQKFLFPDELGEGRFQDIGFAFPQSVASFVGVFEIGCGALLLLGLGTRLAAIPMIVNMVMAIISTRLSILFGQDLGPFQVRDVRCTGSGVCCTKCALITRCCWSACSS
jgi:hypothetical protein